jgi:hypothetical protein
MLKIYLTNKLSNYLYAKNEKNIHKITYFMSCKGITKKGIACSRGGKYDGYCYQHKQSVENSDTESEPEQTICKFILKNKRCVKQKMQGREYCKTHKCAKRGCISHKIPKSRYCSTHTEENKRISDERKRVEEEKKEDINREQYSNYLQSLLDTIQIYENTFQTYGNTIERYRNIIERDARRSVFIEPTIDSLVPTEAKQTSFECVVCQTNQIQTVITPCMHACYCSGCAKTALRFSQDCPKCRRKVEKISPLYI